MKTWPQTRPDVSQEKRCIFAGTSSSLNVLSAKEITVKGALSAGFRRTLERRSPMKGYRRDPERTEVRVLRRHVPFMGARILDIGCGEGRLTRRIAGVARAVVAIDPNAALIARAKQLTPASLQEKVRYRTGAAEHLRLAPQSFEVAVFSWSL